MEMNSVNDAGNTRLTTEDGIDARLRRAEKGMDEPLVITERNRQQLGNIACESTAETVLLPESHPNSRTWCEENFSN